MSTISSLSGVYAKNKWTAFLLVKDFAINGGAMLAVDVESWENDNDVSLIIRSSHYVY